MQYRFLYSTLAAVALSGAVAQDLSNLPSCAQGPALSSITTTGCQLTDFACICRSSDFINSLVPIVQSACSPEDFQKVQAFAGQLCGSVGVSVGSIPTASPTASPAASTSTSTSTGSASSTPTTTTTESVETTTSPTTTTTAATSTGGASQVAVERVMGLMVPLGLIGVAMPWLG